MNFQNERTVSLLFGLVGIALGVHLLGPSQRMVDWHKFGMGALVLSVGGAFFSGVLGGWVAGKIAGLLRAEPAMLHGAIVWLVTVPLLLTLAALGAGRTSWRLVWRTGWTSSLGRPPECARSGTQRPA